ncbi:uncharacterized protein LOC108924643 [Scleropages formosus]|uniref:Uncharacterized LOC108924643 n=1 Tax=Scleropages formosus TaxID=113540 RepID=A0A8C9UY22_SCLFO|nr:uncharacterized protein LOC108924643 [Scleropages formosus]
MLTASKTMLTVLARALPSLWALLVRTGCLAAAVRAQTAPGLPRWGCSVQLLDLSFGSIASVRRSDLPAQALCCTAMNLSHNRIGEIGGGAFVGLSVLRELDLSDNRLERLPRSAFWRLERLRTVLLSNNRFTTIPGALRQLTGLWRLSLTENRISWVDVASLRGCGALRELHLEHNRISAVSPAAFVGLQSLKMLNLSTNSLETVPTPAIQHLWEAGVTVHLHGNPWRCDCRWLTRWGRSPGWPTDEGQCLGTVLRGCRVPLGVSALVTVRLPEEGPLTLPCPGQRLSWYTPFGRWENSSVQDSRAPVVLMSNGSLRISQPSCHHTGLYYCLLQESGGNRILPYRLIQAAPSWAAGLRTRKRRGAQAYGDAVPQGQFEAAVTVSVVITFLAGFSLGALSRSFLERCFHRLRAKRAAVTGPRVSIYSLPVRYKRATSQKAPPANSSSSPPQSMALPPGSLAPPTKAPRNIRNREAEIWDCEGAADTAAKAGGTCGEKCPPLGGQNRKADSSDESDITAEVGSCKATSESPQCAGSHPQQPHAFVEPNARTTRRRVIKLYHYDEDGNPYSYVKDTESQSAPSTRQRSLSLTRLNAIMAAATVTDFTRVPPPPPPQDSASTDREPSDDTPVFELSI